MTSVGTRVATGKIVWTTTIAPLDRVACPSRFRLFLVEGKKRMDRRDFLKLAASGVAASGVTLLSSRLLAGAPPAVIWQDSSVGAVAAAHNLALDARSVLWECGWGSGAESIGFSPAAAELPAWGPTALKYCGDHLVVADAVNSRLLWVDDGKIARTEDIPVELSAVDFVGVPDSDDVVAVLVVNQEQPGVYYFGGGRELDRVPLLRSDSGSAIGLVQGRSGPEYLTEYGTAGLGDRLAPRSDVRLFELPYGFDIVVGHDEVTGAQVEVNGFPATLPRIAPIREIRPITSFPSGVVYLLAHQVITDWDGTILVQPTAMAFDRVGQLVGVARYPVEDALYVPYSPVAIAPDGMAVALVPTPGSAQIRRLDWTLDVGEPPWSAIRAAVLRPPDEGDYCIDGCLGDVGVTGALAACVPNATMASTANGYIACAKYLDDTDINGPSCSTSCDGVTYYRTKPPYLTTPKTYYSVPYQWGGFDKVSDYTTNMTNNSKRAGDINCNCYVKPCASGVDCAGFVSRCWQLTRRYSTKSGSDYYLGDISFSVGEALRGDVFLKTNYHVILVDYESDVSGVKCWESTTGSSNRVVNWFRSWGDLGGYVRRRYNSRC